MWGFATEQRKFTIGRRPFGLLHLRHLFADLIPTLKLCFLPIPNPHYLFIYYLIMHCGLCLNHLVWGKHSLLPIIWAVEIIWSPDIQWDSSGTLCSQSVREWLAQDVETRNSSLKMDPDTKHNLSLLSRHVAWLALICGTDMCRWSRCLSQLGGQQCMYVKINLPLWVAISFKVTSFAGSVNAAILRSGLQALAAI